MTQTDEGLEVDLRLERNLRLQDRRDLQAAITTIQIIGRERDWYRMALLLTLRHHEELREAMGQILQWADAYPPGVFPDQNLQDIDSLLREAGYSMTALHGQWGRQIASGIGKIAREALAEEQRPHGSHD